MKLKNHSTLLTSFFFLTILVCPLPLVAPGQCVLNFSTYPYVPINECGSVSEDMSKWDSNGFPKTLCCRIALSVISEAMAWHARSTLPQGQSSVFINQQELQSCDGVFHPQVGMSLRSCGLDNLYSGGSQCSNLGLQQIQVQQQYQEALEKCAHFDQPFQQSCADCSSAIFSVRDQIYGPFVKDNNDTERAICGVAAVISVAAGKQNDPSLPDEFLRCLSVSSGGDHSSFFNSASGRLLINVLLAVIAITLIIILVKYVSKKKPRKAANAKEIRTWSGLYWFSKDEIESAMNYWNQRICLGRGSAGQVYKGILPSGQVVAIKHLSKTNSSDSFTREVEGLSRLRHPNLVCLFGCCNEDGERYLVYEFCASGNLAQHLLRRDRQLTWEIRVKILRDCAFALKYLHHHIEGCVVHRDIKLTNILLTENLQAKLSDFGLAKMLGMEESKVFTDVRGTIGYMDPEYMSNAKLTCASDVYSFGIVALQILSGQKVIELDLDARDQLTRKARDVSMGKRPLSDFEDPRLNGEINKADFEAILQIAVLCVAKSSKGRPTIEVVFEELDKVYKNTVAEEKAKLEVSTSTPKSSELPV